MRITSVSTPNASTALELAVYRKVQDQTKAQAAALVQMLLASGPAHLGQRLDVRV
jgi:hypothetical protein